MAKPKNSIRIEVFRTGTFKPMAGDAISYGSDDLAGIASSYDPDAAPAPVVIGHPTTDAPAFGWVSGFEYDETADRLYADIGDLEPTFCEAVKAGRYKKVSMSFHTPDAPNNPTPGKWYAKHVGFLGGAAPAVSGLKPVQFTEPKEGEAVTFEASFAQPGFQDAAGLFRGLRDFFIEQFGLEKADEVLPSYRIDWLDDAEITEQPKPAPLFAAPVHKETKMPPTAEEIAAAEADLKKRQDAADVRDAQFAEDSAKRRNADNVAFATDLVKQGKLLPASSDNLVALLDALPADQEVSFSEGDAQSLDAAVMALFSAQPAKVAFGAHDLGDDPGDVADDAQSMASFAMEYQAEQAAIGNVISISDAVVHVSKGAAK